MSSVSARRLTAVPFLASLSLVLAGCSASDVASPVVPGPALATPSALVSADGVGFFSDSTDAAGNVILTQEFAAGGYENGDGTYGSVASVTVRTVIHAYVPSATSQCVSSTIVATDALPGVALSVKKAGGGCNKDIEVLVEQKTPKRKATFKFSMVPGKTVIDSGLLK